MFCGRIVLLLGLFLAACTYYVDDALEIEEITLVEVVAHNQRLKLTPSIKNVSKGVVYNWSATCGSFDDVNSPAPMYIAPEKSGYCIITLNAVKGGKSTIKSDYIAIETPVSGYPVMAKIDGLTPAPIANLSAGSAVFTADQGDGSRLYKITVPSGSAAIDSVPSLPIEGGVYLLAANSSGKIAVLTGDAPRKVLLYEGAALSKTPTLMGNYPASEADAYSPLGLAAFALTDDYLLIGSRSETETSIEIYALSDMRNANIKTPQEIGELVSIAAQKVGGATFLLLGGSAGTKAYSVNAEALSVTPLDSTPADAKASLQIKWNATYALESKLNNSEVAVWKWESPSPKYIGSVYAPNGEDKSPVRAFQLDAFNKATVVSFNGGNVYEVDPSAAVGGNILPKKLIFAYPMHIGEGFSSWAVEKAGYGGNDYYVITGSYYSTLGDTAPGTALIFKATPNIALGAVPEAAIYFGGVVDMLRTITDGGKYFYAAKDREGKKFVIKEIK
jgi:hypothetical protein